MHIAGKVGSTRLTKNYARTRKFQPGWCIPKSFRTKKIKGGFLVFCKSERTGKMVLQAKAKRR